jgi:hypothetical protein
MVMGPGEDPILRTTVMDWIGVLRESLCFSHCELLLLEAGSLRRGLFGNPEEGERLPLEAAT